MGNSEFRAYCRSELVKSLQSAKAGKHNDNHKSRTEGLLQAARLLGIMSAKEIADLIEKEHLAIFNESVSVRKAKKDKLTTLKKLSPDEYFDIPAVERKR
jgi:molybdenum cofactor biosynthesis enzyme